MIHNLPSLTVDSLSSGGFIHLASWTVRSEKTLALSNVPSTAAGVYAFVLDGTAQYVSPAIGNTPTDGIIGTWD